MLSNLDIKSLLRVHLDTMTNKPQIAYEGEPFEPTVGTAYLREFDVGGLTFSPAYTDGYTELPGVYQIDVCTPIKTGTNNNWENLILVDKVVKHFPKNLELTRNNIRLRFQKVDHTPARAEGGWLIASLSIYYQVIGI